MAERRLRCYLRGRGDEWEAFCIDLDLAVQGSSESEVRDVLLAAIRSYVEDAEKEDPETAERLLSRQAPFSARAKFGLQSLTYALTSARRNGSHQATFEVPCPA